MKSFETKLITLSKIDSIWTKNCLIQTDGAHSANPLFYHLPKLGWVQVVSKLDSDWGEDILNLKKHYF